MKEPYYEKCGQCALTNNSDFSCFFIHATSEQKEALIMFCAGKGWKQQAQTFSQHQSKSSKARHAKRTPEQRSAYAKMMVKAREAKRAKKNKTSTKSE